MTTPSISAPKRGLKYFLRLAVFMPFALLLVLWILSAYQGYIGVNELLHPVRNVFCCNTPADSGYEYEQLSLTTEDNLELSGWYLPSANQSAIIMAHGLHGNRADLWNLGRRLHDNGFGVLLLDLRTHGESEGTVFTKGWLDILTAIEYLQSVEVEHIGAYGFSLGANMVIQAAAQYESIEAVVADGASPVTLSDFPMPTTLAGFIYLPYDLVYWSRLEAASAADGGFSIMPNREAVRAIAPRPLLLIAAGAEGSGFETNVNESFFNTASPETTQYWVIEDVYHGGGFPTYPDEYITRLITFYNEALVQ